DGSDLTTLTSDLPFPPTRAAECIRTIAVAVEYAHRQGVLHRDLKPSHILMGPYGRPRITDFRLARQTVTDSSLNPAGAPLGTPGYLPPEQASGKRDQTGRASDVYALGATLYHLLTGHPPFVASALADALKQVIEQEPIPLRRVNPAIPRDLETICLRC